jgi:hypothetical protein
MRLQLPSSAFFLPMSTPWGPTSTAFSSFVSIRGLPRAFLSAALPGGGDVSLLRLRVFSGGGATAASSAAAAVSIVGTISVAETTLRAACDDIADDDEGDDEGGCFDVGADAIADWLETCGGGDCRSQAATGCVVAVTRRM